MAEKETQYCADRSARHDKDNSTRSRGLETKRGSVEDSARGRSSISGPARRLSPAVPKTTHQRMTAVHWRTRTSRCSCAITSSLNQLMAAMACHTGQRRQSSEGYLRAGPGAGGPVPVGPARSPSLAGKRPGPVTLRPHSLRVSETPTSHPSPRNRRMVIPCLDQWSPAADSPAAARMQHRRRIRRRRIAGGGFAGGGSPADVTPAADSPHILSGGLLAGLPAAVEAPRLDSEIDSELDSEQPRVSEQLRVSELDSEQPRLRVGHRAWMGYHAWMERRAWMEHHAEPRGRDIGSRGWTRSLGSSRSIMIR
jgi:hypothetical protein